MTKDEMQMMSFKIIACSGQAFSMFYEAVNEAEKGNYDKTEEYLSEGMDALNEAHREQTAMLTAEANGEELPYSIMMVHAQDHLNTAIMYEKIAKQMIRLCRKMEE